MPAVYILLHIYCLGWAVMDGLAAWFKIGPRRQQNLICFKNDDYCAFQVITQE